jgi:putative CocE/NonD family hydrolase
MRCALRIFVMLLSVWGISGCADGNRQVLEIIVPVGEGADPIQWAREDVVVFQTDLLEQDIEVIGPIEVRLFVSSTAVDTDFTAKLIDVYPPSTDYPTGYDMNNSDAIVRASYRDGRTERDLIEPGQVYEIVIEPFETANLFKAGHRIRLDISSSNFPRFAVNPNTGEPLGRNRRWIKANNTIYHSAERIPHVVLPIMRPR